MANTPTNGTAAPSFTPRQICALLVIEQAQSSLSLGATQLANLGLQPEANSLRVALMQLEQDKKRFIDAWSSAVQLAPASALASVIEGKTH